MMDFFKKGNEGHGTMKARLTAVIIGLILFFGATASQALDKVRCEVLTIEASRSGQGVDPALAQHASIFQKAPFSGFDTFKLVHRQSHELTLGTPVALAMPQPLTGALQFNNRLQGRLDLTLSIMRPQRSPILISGKATPGSPFFAAGLKSAHGRWVFGIICDRANGVIHHH